MINIAKPPKVYISYCWTTLDYEEWVVKFATDLVTESRVKVILDKWYLREGDDANAFMERMVTDPTVDKVIILCDHQYVEKANSRRGGVGTETQIISSEVYGKVNKFIAVITERDEDGKACLPVFYRSRIYIDFSDDDKIANNYEQLLRCIYNKPQYEPPQLGANSPAFLTEENSILLGTDTSFRLTKQAIRGGRGNASGLISEYLELYSKNLERFRIKLDGENLNSVDKILDNINSFLPYRNQICELFKLIAQYQNLEAINSQLHSFFESLIPYLFAPDNVRDCEWYNDNYIFIVEELFLFCLAILIKNNRFILASTLINNEYFFDTPHGYGMRVKLHDFNIFQPGMRSLAYKQATERMNVYDLHAKILEERAKNSFLKSQEIHQVDFILFLVDAKKVLEGLNVSQRWYAKTMIYQDTVWGEFEIFNRATSYRFFDKIKCLFDINNKEELGAVFDAFKNRRLRKIEYGRSIDPDYYVGFEELCTKP